MKQCWAQGTIHRWEEWEAVPARPVREPGNTIRWVGTGQASTITRTLLSPTYTVIWDHYEVPTEDRDADVASVRAELKEPFCPSCPKSLNPQAPCTLGQGC